MLSILSKMLHQNSLLVTSVFLVLFTLVGFVVKKRKEKGKPIVAPRIMRYLILPAALVYTICIFILKLPRTEVSIKITETILIIFGIYFLLHMISHLFFSKDNILSGKESVPKLGRDIILFILILISGAFVFSSIWGIDLGHLLTALDVGSFVIGLALQEPLGNLFNGISLLIAQPFEKGDWVTIGDDTGKIVDINWRSSKIVNRYNDFYIKYGLWAFMKDFENQILLKNEITTKIYQMTKDQNFTIPFPIQNIYIKKNKND